MPKPPSTAEPASPPRRTRGRPPKIDAQEVLKVAREVFFARGIRATTAEVAEKAGISEGSIFKHFTSKENLFREAMQFSEADAPRLFLDMLEGMKGSSSLEEGLHYFTDRMVEIARVALPLAMMAWSNPTKDGGPMCEKAEKFQAHIKILASYFEGYMEAGQLRRVDSEVLARVFIGAMHHYCMSRMFADQFGLSVVPEDMFKRGLIDLILNGARLQDPCPSSPYVRRTD